MFIWSLLGDIWTTYIYDMGILGGVKSRRRLYLRVSISIYFFLSCVSVSPFSSGHKILPEKES